MTNSNKRDLHSYEIRYVLHGSVNVEAVSSEDAKEKFSNDTGDNTIIKNLELTGGCEIVGVEATRRC